MSPLVLTGIFVLTVGAKGLGIVASGLAPGHPDHSLGVFDDMMIDQIHQTKIGGEVVMRKKLIWAGCLAPLLLLASLGIAWAAEAAPKIDSGDTAFVLIGAALVLLMTPGLAFFYGGMVRRKNVLSTIMHSFIIICLISVQWVIYGYGLAFGPDKLHLIGSLSWLGLNGVGFAPYEVAVNGARAAPYGATIPHLVYMAFQMMFAVITAALISGSFAERFRFPAFLIFTLLWTTIVYDPLAHWVWGYGGGDGGPGAVRQPRHDRLRSQGVRTAERLQGGVPGGRGEYQAAPQDEDRSGRKGRERGAGSAVDLPCRPHR
jgi:hypothetical protein